MGGNQGEPAAGASKPSTALDSFAFSLPEPANGVLKAHVSKGVSMEPIFMFEKTKVGSWEQGRHSPGSCRLPETEPLVKCGFILRTDTVAFLK